MIKRKYKKNVIITTLVILSIIITSIFYMNYKQKQISPSLTLTPKDNVFIYGDWYGNINIKKNDSVLINIPVYDFNKELGNIDDELLKGYIRVENLNAGLIEDINIEKGDTRDYTDRDKNNRKFDCYTLSIVLKMDKTGQFNIDDSTVYIDTQKDTYSSKLGKFSINVLEPENLNQKDITVVGGTGLIDIYHNVNQVKNSNKYELECTLKNNSDGKMKIKSIDLNDSKLASIEFKEIELLPNQEKTIKYELYLDKSIYKCNIFPKISYTVNDKEYITVIPQTLIADSVPIERLKELVENH